MKLKTMTKDYFIKLADYNVWANNLVCSWLEQVSESQWNQEVVSSFNSIQATVLHLISAEYAWVQRMNKVENVEWLATSFKGTKAEHIALWKDTSAKLKQFIIDFDENNLQVNYTFKRINGEVNTLPYYQTIAHAINHGSYHRGQLVTMLRQVGFTGVGSTDLLNYFRL
ncbi:MAG: DinB family protein [Ferruginibacter sp.]